VKELIQNCQNKQEVNQVFRLTAPLSLDLLGNKVN